MASFRRKFKKWILPCGEAYYSGLGPIHIDFFAVCRHDAFKGVGTHEKNRRAFLHRVVFADFRGFRGPETRLRPAESFRRFWPGTRFSGRPPIRAAVPEANASRTRTEISTSRARPTKRWGNPSIRSIPTCSRRRFRRVRRQAEPARRRPVEYVSRDLHEPESWIVDVTITLRPMTIDGNGNVYVICSNAVAAAKPYVAKINSLGARQWLVSIGGVGTDYRPGHRRRRERQRLRGRSRAGVLGNAGPRFRRSSRSVLRQAEPQRRGPMEYVLGRGCGQIRHTAWALPSTGAAMFTRPARATPTWGWPIRPYTPSGDDAFVVKFDSSGALLWNTFLGAAQDDMGCAIKIGR